MTSPFTPDAPVTDDGDFEHVAVFYEGVDELVELLADDIATAVDDGERVLVCIDVAAWNALEQRLGDRAAEVTYLADDVRYSKPAEAMRAVNEFVRDALDDGAPAVRSIGVIPLDGQRDEDWIRYEAAVNEVLAQLPFKGICLYDTSTLAPELAREVAAAHRTVVHPDGRRDHVGGATSLPAVPALDPPTAPPDVVVEVDTSSTARCAVRGPLAADVPADIVDEVLLSLSELVTNGRVHGRQPITVEMWLRPGRDVHIAVTDHGTGIDDPFFELRPPAPDDVGGAGLWIVGQLADRVDSRMQPDGAHRVVARFALPA